MKMFKMCIRDRCRCWNGWYSGAIKKQKVFRLIWKQYIIKQTSSTNPNTPLPLPREQETTYETLPTAEELISTPEGWKSFVDYIDIWFKGLLARQYMRKFFNDNDHDIDHVFGPYFTNGTKLMLGIENWRKWRYYNQQFYI